MIVFNWLFYWSKDYTSFLSKLFYICKWLKVSSSLSDFDSFLSKIRFYNRFWIIETKVVWLRSSKDMIVFIWSSLLGASVMVATTNSNSLSIYSLLLFLAISSKSMSLVLIPFWTVSSKYSSMARTNFLRLLNLNVHF